MSTGRASSNWVLSQYIQQLTHNKKRGNKMLRLSQLRTRAIQLVIVPTMAIATLVSALSAPTAAQTKAPVNDAAGLGAASKAWWSSRPAIANVKPSKHIRIVMLGFAENPFWVGVKNGANAANAALKSHNASVTWTVVGNTADVPSLNAAVNAAAAQGYQGIGFFIAGAGNCSVIKRYSAQGIALGVYNTLIPCVASSGGIVDYAQAQYNAGYISAKRLISADHNKKGEVGIIVSLFSAPGSEYRRLGFLAGLKGSNITPVNKGVQADDSASTSFTEAQQFLESTPDLVGIYCTAGGPFGAAEAVAAAHKQATVKVIGYDVTAEDVTALKNGSMYGVTGQDAYGQGYDVAIALFNKLAANKRPPAVMQESYSPFVTASNLSRFCPTDKDVSGSLLGCS